MARMPFVLPSLVTGGSHLGYPGLGISAQEKLAGVMHIHKFIVHPTIWLAAVIILGACTTIPGPVVHGKTTVVSTVVEFSSAELEKLASTIEKERLKIVEYLGSGGNRKFHYEIGTITYITRWRCQQTVKVNITPYHVRNNIVPISNPIASCLIGSGFNSLLRIGFYTYAQDRFGSNKAFPNYGVDLHSKSGDLLATGDYGSPKDKPLHISSEIFRAMSERGRSKNERTAARIFAASFCKYLIEDVLGDDIERFKRIYMTGDFLKEAKLSFAELEKQWSEDVTKSRP